VSISTAVKRSDSDIEALMRPRSVAIIGVSAKPGSAGRTVLKNLLANGYDGLIHLVGRSGGLIDGRPCLTSVTELPSGVDLAILVTPAEAVRDTIAACVARGVRSAVCFSSGFAEMGDGSWSYPRQVEWSHVCPPRGGWTLVPGTAVQSG